MDQPSAHKQFIFNEKIDSDCLVGLYEYDFAYIAQVFGISVESFETDLPPLYAAYAAADLTALCRAVHKLKPVFGFTGLLSHQAALAEFEDICLQATDHARINTAYEKLLTVIEDGRKILGEEAERLNLFAG